MRIIGVTGGVGAGKSAILNYIKEHYKCRINLADEVANELKRPGTDCYRKLVDILGKDVLNSDGTIDKKRMSGKIFNDGVLLSEVNSIIHPAVREYLLNAMEEARKDPDTELFFVEAALLIECGYKALVDEMWYIYADQDTRRRRLKENRQYSDDRIDGIIASQLSEDDFRKNCDFVIDNSGTLQKSFAQIDKKLEAFTWQE